MKNDYLVEIPDPLQTGLERMLHHPCKLADYGFLLILDFHTL